MSALHEVDAVQTHGELHATTYPIGAMDLHTVKASSNGVGCCLTELFNELRCNNSRSARANPHLECFLPAVDL